MLGSADDLRRWLGAFCLAVAAGMLIWGQTVLKSHLEGIWYLLYWVLCFGFTVTAIVFALLDVRAIRRRARNEHRALLERTLKETDSSESEKGEEARSSNDPSDPPQPSGRAK